MEQKVGLDPEVIVEEGPALLRDRGKQRSARRTTRRSIVRSPPPCRSGSHRSGFRRRCLRARSGSSGRPRRARCGSFKGQDSRSFVSWGSDLLDRPRVPQVLEDVLAVEAGQVGLLLRPVRIVEVAIERGDGGCVRCAEVLAAELFEECVRVVAARNPTSCRALAESSSRNSRMLPAFTTENSRGRRLISFTMRKFCSIFHGPSAWARWAPLEVNWKFK